MNGTKRSVCVVCTWDLTLFIRPYSLVFFVFVRSSKVQSRPIKVLLHARIFPFVSTYRRGLALALGNLDIDKDLQ